MRVFFCLVISSTRRALLLFKEEGRIVNGAWPNTRAQRYASLDILFVGILLCQCSCGMGGLAVPQHALFCSVSASDLPTLKSELYTHAKN